MLLVPPNTMAALDRATIDGLGVPGLVLMESAAGAVVRGLLDRHGDAARERGVLVIAGPGNNGGDGVAIARRLAGLGVRAEVLLVADPDRVRGDAKVQLDLAAAQEVPIRVARSEDELQAGSWSAFGVLVDALFGTGLDREVTGLMGAAIDALVGPPVVAVDIPSGIDGTTGQVHGRAVQADLTVTFAAPKVGHFLEPGRTRRGHLVVADIGIPAARFTELTEAAPSLLEATVLDRVAVGARDAHKGTFGHVLVVAGSPGKAGAARLSAEAALRAGAGLVTLAIPASLPLDSLARIAPEVMVERIDDEGQGTFGPESVDSVLALAATRDALALGPGLGTEPRTVAFVQRLYAEAPVPAVVDADALNALAQGGVPSSAAPRVLTPHPGEMARLTGTSTAELRAARLPSSRALAGRTGAVVVLKGAGTVIARPDGQAALNPTGNPGMGTAGSGDVLTGMIGALLGRGLDPAEAAEVAVFWHGHAGDVAAAAGETTLVASDITGALASALSTPPQRDWSTEPAGWTP